MRDADVTHAALGLQALQRLQVRLPVQQVVDLHEVDSLRPQQAKRIFHLRRTRRLAARPHLGGDEERAMQLELRSEFAEDAFGTAVHG